MTFSPIMLEFNVEVLNNDYFDDLNLFENGELLFEIKNVSQFVTDVTYDYLSLNGWPCGTLSLNVIISEGVGPTSY